MDGNGTKSWRFYSFVRHSVKIHRKLPVNINQICFDCYIVPDTLVFEVWWWIEMNKGFIDKKNRTKSHQHEIFTFSLTPPTENPPTQLRNIQKNRGKTQFSGCQRIGTVSNKTTGRAISFESPTSHTHTPREIKIIIA